MAAVDVNSDVEALKKDLSNLRGDLRSLRDNLTTQLREHAASSTNDFGATARSAASSVGAAGERSYSAAARQIEANPLTSVLVAAGIGLVIGSMLRR